MLHKNDNVQVSFDGSEVMMRKKETNLLYFSPLPVIVMQCSGNTVFPASSSADAQYYRYKLQYYLSNFYLFNGFCIFGAK
ncbi:hypothetical protein MtrunA17_Chr1g0205641 [Medicago truncatula]|uniref:Transmembrane protein, putative n=1 Tax=Medicago truncatula TaxID=3880 RepID=G7ID75_MEDTR|nr:transmembrane protein, putative [Medicago truncatula]RHN82044.1 hypothetical protein MtrunA17_Chr1g0205641 [Medicago truncatula]